MSSNFKSFNNDLDLLSGLFSTEGSHGLEPSQFTFPYLFDSFMPTTTEDFCHPDDSSTQNEPLRVPESPNKSIIAITDAFQLQRNISFPSGEVDSLSGDVTSSQDDDDNSNSGSDPENLKKRGKYRTYTEQEKAHIIDFATKYGVDKTLELFSNYDNKITKRKLKGWLDGLNKAKGVKGRKSSDPARDQALSKWCEDFKNKHHRFPSRKEATRKALDLNGDPNFQASKGWLDKFSRKYKIEFTPFKAVPPKPSKKVKIAELDTKSAASTVDSATLENTPPSVSFGQEKRLKKVMLKDSFGKLEEKPQTNLNCGLIDFCNKSEDLIPSQCEVNAPRELYGSHLYKTRLPHIDKNLFDNISSINNEQFRTFPYPMCLPGNSQLPAPFDFYRQNLNKFQFLSFEKTVNVSYQP